MRRISKKKKLVATLAAVALLGAGGAAYAYWTNTGAGTGSAATGTTLAVVVNQTSVVSGLAPGLAAQPLSGNFDNPNSGPVLVTGVTATVTGTDKAGCGASDYIIAGTAPVGVEVASGNAVGSWSGLSIQFNNKPGTSQDACKNAIVSLSFTSN